LVSLSASTLAAQSAFSSSAFFAGIFFAPLFKTSAIAKSSRFFRKTLLDPAMAGRNKSGARWVRFYLESFVVQSW
jgi:hypothetical protein